MNATGIGTHDLDLFNRCTKFQRAKELIKTGYYPYFRPISEAHDGTESTVFGRRLIMFGSNNYLGLTHDPRVQEAARKAVERYGTGCTGSRFLNGTLDIHEELEDRLARFTGKEAALTFSTGFQANLGSIALENGRMYEDCQKSQEECRHQMLEWRAALGYEWMLEEPQEPSPERFPPELAGA